MKKSLGAVPLVFPMPAFLVASYDPEGKPNIMTAAWGGIASSGPPCVYVSVRPARYTYESILAAKAFTVNIPNSRLAVATDFAGIVSGKNVDKFAKTGLTPVKSDVVNAPYVAECPVVLECELYKTVDLDVHTMMIGKIIDVKAEEGLEGEGSTLDILKVDPMIYNPGGHYHRVGEAVAKAFAIGKTVK